MTELGGGGGAGILSSGCFKQTQEKSSTFPMNREECHHFQFTHLETFTLKEVKTSNSLEFQFSWNAQCALLRRDITSGIKSYKSDILLSLLLQNMEQLKCSIPRTRIKELPSNTHMHTDRNQAAGDSNPPAEKYDFIQECYYHVRFQAYEFTM